MNLSFIQSESEKYSASLIKFLAASNLQQFSGQVDHFGIKCYDTSDYERTLEELLPVCSTAQYVVSDGRRMATARLFAPIDFGQFGKCDLLEIMEPKPEKVGKTLVGFDHTEILAPNYAEVQAFIEQNKISIKEQKVYDSHKSIVFLINDLNQEVKFTDTSLNKILELEAHEGKLIKLK